MYEVSSDYIAAIKKPAIRTRVFGTIGDEPFNDDNILAGSFSITNQNSANDKVQIGTVYIGELGITLRGLNLERYSLNNKKITAEFQLLLGDGETWESVPLGEYYVSEANYTAAGIEIKAYDIINKFDKNFSGEVFSAKPYDLVKYACDNCNVELGTAQSEFELFPNGTETLALWQEGSDIETWRDYLSWVSQACCCYCTASRDGKLILRQYSQDVVDTVGTTGRFSGASYSDYETRYTGIYVTNLSDNIMNYYGAEVDDALTYSLGTNPFLQFGSESDKERIRRAVLDGLGVIDYVPFSLDVPENPAYDLGDVLRFPNGLGDGSKLFCINKFVWKYHRSMRIEGVGENPILATAQSKTEKNISGLMSKIDSTKIVIYNFVNLGSFNIGSTNTEVMSLDIFTNETATAMFIGEILIDITADDVTRSISGIARYEEEPEPEPVPPETEPIEPEPEPTPTEPIIVEKSVTFDFVEKAHPILTVTYRQDEIVIAEFVPKQVCHEGKQIITLFYPLQQIEKNSSSNFTVSLKLENGHGTIAEKNVRASISGQGLVSETAEWNGRIRLTDMTPEITLDEFYISINSVSDDVQTVTE